MTKKELSQLYYLKKEIEQQQLRIKQLEDMASNKTQSISSDIIKTNCISDKVGKYAAEIADLRCLLGLNLKKYLSTLRNLEEYIQNVEDSEMRLILTLRYVQNTSWYEIAKCIGYKDESVPRKRHNRFLAKKKSDRYIRI